LASATLEPPNLCTIHFCIIHTRPLDSAEL
jgi:hypothetical protein